MNGFSKFLASTVGRVVRSVAGILIIILAYMYLDSPWNYVGMAFGLLPFLAGVLDFCIFAPLAKLPFSGKDLRSKLS